MLTTIKEPFVIISANVIGQTVPQATMANLKLKQRLTELGYTFKIVYGKYQGETETSFYIPHLGCCGACDLCLEFNQETYLDVKENREAFLVNTDTLDVEPLGYFMQGEDDDNYTIDQGVKYVCRG